jgi:hypothetical protein
VEALRPRFLIGLHHNWHDHTFSYDPLFDFSMAGDGDLIERDGKSFPRIPIDACNFAPACFTGGRDSEPFWDVLNTSRAVFFKGLPEFYQAIRKIYDEGRLIRVLHLCPVPPANSEGTHLHDIRQRFEAIFSLEERQYFTLMTMDWDNPFPLDLETLAFFYRASRVYVHPSPDERRCRAAGYAWARKMPVVARENVASILPSALRRRPFWFEYSDPSEMGDAILKAVYASRDDGEWGSVVKEFCAVDSVVRLEGELAKIASARDYALSRSAVNPSELDIRLGRHHGMATGRNNVDQTLAAFCGQLRSLSDSELEQFAAQVDPEAALATDHCRNGSITDFPYDPANFRPERKTPNDTIRSILQAVTGRIRSKHHNS